MAGYTRQSIAEILNGLDVTAPPINAEFNAMAAAFDAVSGHLHDGSTGAAPPLPLETSVTGYLPAASGGTGGKNNLAATAPPSITNDNIQGYAPGSIWLNTTDGRVYRCVGNSSGAATWREELHIQNANLLAPRSNNSVDLGTDATRFRSLFLAAALTVGGAATIGGSLAVTGPLTASGGLTGNLTGNVTGNLTGNVTATSGNSSFNNVTVNGTFDVTNTPIRNVAAPTGANDAANKGYVDSAVASLISSAPGTLDTLNELAAALGDDPNFATTVSNDIAKKLDKAGGTVTGLIAMSGYRITGLGAPTTGSDAVTLDYVTALYGSTSSAAASAAKAQRWADENENVAIEGGKYSAKHHALKSAASAASVQGLEAQAQSSADAAAESETAAGSSAAAASASKTASETAKTASEAARDKAQEWADKGENLTVETGKYSAKHHALKTAASETAAASSASAASSSASTADSHRADAAASAGAAQASETNASASASAAATSATNSANSAAAAAASFDSFDDRYLGAKASEPTTDNDGNSILRGALFYDTSVDAVKIWTDTVWRTIDVVSTFPNVNSAVNATDEELNFVAGVTGGIQAQINGKVAESHGYGHDLNFGKYIHLNDYDDAEGSNKGIRSYVRDGVWFINKDVSETNPIEIRIEGGKVWTAGNDGSGSGLDADLLRGFGPSSGNVPSTMALRTSSGDVSMRLARSEYASSGSVNSVASVLMRVNDSNDNFHRPITPSGFVTWLNANNAGLNADTLDGFNSHQFLRSDIGDTMYGNLVVTGDVLIDGEFQVDHIRTRTGQPLTIAGGDLGPIFESSVPNDEYVHIGSESGVRAYSSPDNLASGWGGLHIATLLDINGNTDLPGRLTTQTARFEGAGDWNPNGVRVSGNAPSVYFNQTEPGANAFIGLNGSTFYVLRDVDQDGTYDSVYPLQLSLDGADVARVHGNDIWHNGNDGPGSGLNADMLDGYHSTNFARFGTTNGNPDGYLVLSRTDSSNSTLYVRQRGSGDIARFFNDAASNSTGSVRSVTITNEGGIDANGLIDAAGGFSTPGEARFTGEGGTSGIRFASTAIGNDQGGIRMRGPLDAGELEFWTSDNGNEPFYWRSYPTSGSAAEWMRLSGAYLSLGGKHAIQHNDSFLRLNPSNDFTSGIYTPGDFRTNGSIIVPESVNSGVVTVGGDRLITGDNAGVLRIGDTTHSVSRLHGTGSGSFRVYYSGSDKTIYHTGNDGELFKRNGSVGMTGTLNMQNHSLLDVARIYWDSYGGSIGDYIEWTTQQGLRGYENNVEEFCIGSTNSFKRDISCQGTIFAQFDCIVAHGGNVNSSQPQVGQIVFARNDSTSDVYLGDMHSGSNLQACSANGNDNNGSLTGTYICLGFASSNGAAASARATLWQRIS